MASAMKGSSSTTNTRMLRCYEPAHIVGISKTAYVPATPRSLEWGHALQRSSANDDPSDPGSQVGGVSPVCWQSASRRSPVALGYRSLASSSSIASSNPAASFPGERRGALDEALPSTAWPAFGQAAVQTGRSQIQAGPNQQDQPNQ